MRKANIAEHVNTVSPAEYLGFVNELVAAEREIDRTTDEAAAAKAAASAAKGVKRGILKRAEKAGTDIEALKSVASLRALDSHDRNRLMENTFLYAAWEGLELWHAGTPENPQGTMFESDPDAQEAWTRLADSRDFSDGYNTAKGGGLHEECRYQAGERGHQAWMRGYRDYEQEHGEITQPVPEPEPSVAAPSRRRGRPRLTPDTDTEGSA